MSEQGTGRIVRGDEGDLPGAPALPAERYWSEERVLRVLFVVGTLVGLVGLAWTLGATVAPWVGWLAAALGFGVGGLLFVRRMLDENEQLRAQVSAQVGNRFHVLPPSGGRDQGWNG